MAKKETFQEKKILCFVTDDETEETLRTIQFSDYGLTADIQRGETAKAVKYIRENRSPDILLVDLSKDSFPVTSIAALSEVCEPHVEVIAIGDRNEVGIFRDLLHAGVHDYIVKPLPASMLIRTFEELSGQSGSDRDALFHRSGRIISVIGAVGGVGVSSLVSNLAWLLAERKMKKVCLLDMDLQLSTISQYLDVTASSGLHQLLESPERMDIVLLERYMAQYSQNLKILSSQLSLKEVPLIKPKAMESTLALLATNFHYIVVDVPRDFISDINQDTLKNASTIILMTDYSITGLKNASYLLEYLKMSLSYNHEVLIVVNKVGEYSEGEIKKDMFESTLESSVFLEIPFDRQYPLKALRDGTPVSDQGVGALAKGIKSIEEHLLGHITDSVRRKESSTGLFGGLLKK